LKAQSNLTRERPISSTAAMTRAILDGRKTQTRRLIRENDGSICPLGAAGDRLWVREPWGYAAQFHDTNAEPTGKVIYAADGRAPSVRRAWRRPSFMPRSCSRILLEIVNSEAQPLQQIKSTDAQAEGFIEDQLFTDARQWFAALWDKIYAEQGFAWNTNPRIWAITFRVL
jgi:hypothetical protein